MKLPESFYEVAKDYGVPKEDILFGAMADFDIEYRFADTVVALTREKLLVAAFNFILKSFFIYSSMIFKLLSEE